MAELGVAYLSVIPETSKFAPTMRKALGKSSGVGDQAGRSIGGRISQTMGKTLKVGAASAFAGAAAVGGAALVKGFQRLEAIDSAKAKLAGLGHSAQSVNTIMDSALKSVKGTAFGMGEAASLAGTLVASGIKPGKDLEKTLSLVGDSATIAGRDLGEMGLVWAQVASKGKLTGEDAMQFMEAGIPVWQLVAKEMGVTAAEAQDMASKGQVSFEVFRSAMEGGLGGAALKSGQTFTGAMKNVGAALSRIGASFLESAFQQMPQIFGAATSALDGLAGPAERAGKVLGDTLAGAIRGVQDVIRGFRSEVTLVRDMGNPFFALGQWAQGAVGAVTAAFNGFTGNKVIRDMGTPAFELGQMFRSVVDPAVEFGKALFDLGRGLAPVAVELAKFAGQVTIVSTFTLLKVTLEALTPIIKALTGWVERNQGVVEALGKAVLIGVAAFKAYKVAMAGLLFAQKVGAAIAFMASAQGRLMLAFRLTKPLVVAQTVATKTWAAVTTVAGAVAKGFAAAFKVLNAAMRANPVGFIITGITLLVGGLILAYKKSETFRKIVDGALRGVAAAFTWLWDKAKAFWGWLSGAFGGGESKKMASSLTAPWQGVKDFFGRMWSGIKGTFNGVVDWVRGFFAKHWKAILFTALLGPFGLIGVKIAENWGAIKSAFSAGADRVKAVFSGMWDGLVSGMQAAWQGVKDGVGAALEFIKTLFLNWTGPGLLIKHWGAISGAVSGAWTKVKDGTSRALGWVGGKLSSGWEAAKGGTSRAWGAISGAVSTGWSNIKSNTQLGVDGARTVASIGWQAMRGDTDGAWSRIKGIVGGAWTAIDERTGGALTRIKAIVLAGFEAVRSYIWAKLEAAKAVVLHAVLAISARFSLLRMRVEQTVLQLRLRVVMFFSQMRDRLVSITVWLGQQIAAIWTGIRDRVSALAGMLRDWVMARFVNLRDRAVALFGWIRDSLVLVFSGMRDRLVSLAGTVRDWIMSRFNNLRDRAKATFRNMVDGIRSIWAGLKRAAAEPVKFVIETVFNKGLIGGWNTLVGLMKLGDKLKVKKIPLPQFYRGGRPDDRVPGSRARGRDSTLAVSSAGVPIARVDPGEGIVRRASMQKLDRTAPGAFEHINKTGTLPGFFHGGRIPTPGPVRPHGLPYYGARWAGDMGYGMGSPIVAWNDGQVASVKRWGYSYGHHVRINHGALGQSLYAHMSKILVSAGQQVKQGDKIGEIGSTGKALDIETPVLTHNRGWVKHGDLVPGDQVYDESGRPVNVTHVAHWKDRPTYRITFSDGSVIDADENHLWAVHDFKERRRGNSDLVTRTTKEIADTYVYGAAKPYKRYSVPVAGALERDSKNYRIDPYALGVWLGDGHAANSRVTVGKGDLAEMQQNLLDADETFNVSPDNGENWRLTLIGANVPGGEYNDRTGTNQHPEAFSVRLKELGLIGNKRIPREYMEGSRTQRLALLQGLLDTDGYVDPRQGTVEFIQAGKHGDLARDVWELALSLGFKATLREGDTMFRGKRTSTRYRVCFTTDECVFRLSRKARAQAVAAASRTDLSRNRISRRGIVSVEMVDSRDTNCITVDGASHLYLAGESLIPTHNSTGPHLHFEIRGGNAPIGSGTADAGGDGGGMFSMFAGWITDKLSSPVKKLIDKIPGSGLFLDAAKGVANKAKDAVVDKITSLLPKGLFDSGVSGATAGGDWYANAKMLMDAGKKLGANRRAMKIALMTAAQESSMGTNRTAMTRINGDGDVGWFQQRATRGDGTVSQLADPLYGLRVFLFGKTIPSGWHVPGLYNKNWGSMGLGQAAQAVQVSAFPRAYDKWADEAEAWLSKYGYWRGTKSAGPGLHVVGERGPELVNFRGGERVWSSPETEGILSGLSKGKEVHLHVNARDGAPVERQIEDAMWHLARGVERQLA